ncbi:MAG TPA: DUF3618 domain-containing protein [Solirubrobacteraceae bacterium]|nr:DUF3618 domain-containing protein [Solirubrobacteraceae bacterium]
MSTGADQPGPSEPTSAQTEELQRDIEQTREELGDTVEALAAKTDVKAQAQRKLEETKASVADKKDELLGKAREASPESASSAASAAADQARQNPMPLAAAGAFVAGFVFGRLTKRRR